MDEYGVHWNFFATVAVVALATHAIALPLSSARGGATRLLALAVAVSVGHQVALTWGECVAVLFYFISSKLEIDHCWPNPWQ